jgi:hypothetical protein
MVRFVGLLTVVLLSMAVLSRPAVPAQEEQACRDVSWLTSAVRYWESLHHEVPTSLEVLVAQELVERTPVDPWGTPYQLVRTSSGEAKVFSAGPDGRPHTRDDVLRCRSGS